MALYFDLSPGDRLQFGDGTSLSLESKSGSRARIRVDDAKKGDVRYLKAAEVARTVPLFRRSFPPAK